MEGISIRNAWDCLSRPQRGGDPLALGRMCEEGGSMTSSSRSVINKTARRPSEISVTYFGENDPYF